MANHCGFCDTRRPVDGTTIMVLGGNWVEFCPLCGEMETLTNEETGETCTVNEVCRRIGGNPPIPDPKRVAMCKQYKKEAQEYEKEQVAFSKLLAEKREKERLKKRGPLRGGVGNMI